MAETSFNFKFNTNENMDEVFAYHKSDDPEVENFDRTIGLIEDIIMDKELHLIQSEFLRRYAHEFDPTLDENKLIYTDIHKEYIITIEDFILNKIKRLQPNFNFDLFATQLVARQYELQEEIFEFLLTFTDFPTFKQWMLGHRQESITLDINSCLQVIHLDTELQNNPR